MTGFSTLPDAPRASQAGQEERLELNIGRRCNQRCIFCMQDSNDPASLRWVPLEHALGELRSFNAAHPGIKSLGLLGGEPTLYPQLFELFEEAKRLSFNHITINTNGFGLADMDFARRAVQLGLRRVCLSIHSESPAIEDELSARPGAYLRKLKAIRNMLLLRREHPSLELSINAVLTTRSLPTMDRFLRFFSHLGIRDIRLNFIRPEGRALNHIDLVPTFSAAMEKLMECVALCERELPVHLTIGEIPYCIYPPALFADPEWRHRYIGEYLDKRTCVTVFLRSRQPLEEPADQANKNAFVWQDEKNAALKRFAPACENCLWAQICGGVWTHYLEIHGSSEFKPIRSED